MYWNELFPSFPVNYFKINRNMRCIEISETAQGEVRGQTINRNMRCIEIYSRSRGRSRIRWLIETWDVLKYDIILWESLAAMINRNMRCIEMFVRKETFLRFIWINRNMRCIEMWLCWSITKLRWQINRNMRCIEICVVKEVLWGLFRLIETWDVLK